MLGISLSFSLGGALARADGPTGDDVYFVVNKSANELAVRSLLEPDRVIARFRAISGANSGDKMVEGDRKTPEGIYFVERELPPNRLLSLHGAAAFELNYPNPYDRIRKRTGYGIWIHGVDNEARMEKRFDTKGCVALSNSQVVELRRWMGPKKMIPVIVMNDFNPAIPNSVEVAESPLTKRVHDWVEAWGSKDAEKYLAFYSPDFYARGMDYKRWSSYKRRLTRNYQKINVDIRNLRIFRHEKYSVALFWQHYTSNRFESSGWKRLYLLGEGEQALILSEEMKQEQNGTPGLDAVPPETVALPRLSAGPQLPPQ
jgi:murein L,D-transpeptidase YafK